MTLVVEISRPFARPFGYKNRSMYRFGFAWFAVAVLRVSFYDFTTQRLDWRPEPRKEPPDGRPPRS